MPAKLVSIDDSDLRNARFTSPESAQLGQDGLFELVHGPEEARDELLALPAGPVLFEQQVAEAAVQFWRNVKRPRGLDGLVFLQ